jgi:RES domain-containing protein
MASSPEAPIWRLVRPAWAPGLDGEGARIAGGRWNSPGHAVVYCGSSLALCVLETFAHLPPALRAVEMLPAMTAVRLSSPTKAPHLRAEDLGSLTIEDTASCRALGDAWITGGASLTLSVPSAIVPQERNIIFNAAHPAMPGVVAVSQEAFRFHPRLGQRAPSGAT